MGWRWAEELARDHQVVVITDTSRRSLIEQELVSRPRTGLTFEYYRPWILRRFPLNSVTAQVLYTIWQFSLLPFARSLNRRFKFDLAMHITYGVFRHPSFLGGLGIPFVFGPLGGGEEAPPELKRSIRGREKVREMIRAAMNKAALADPFLWWSLSRSTLILVKTAETKQALPRPFRQRAQIFPEIGVVAPSNPPIPTRKTGERFQLLYAGRLLGWKGAHLAIRTLHRLLAREIPAVLTIVGSGPFERQLKELASDLGCDSNVRWVRHVVQSELFGIYQNAHCFLFPSLHDSSGNVVLEAQAFGLPVICLDLGGPPMLVTTDSSLVVSTRGRGEDQVVEALASAAESLYLDEDARDRMGRSAVAYARTMTWRSRVTGALELLDAVSQGES